MERWCSPKGLGLAMALLWLGTVCCPSPAISFPPIASSWGSLTVLTKASGIQRPFANLICQLCSCCEAGLLSSTLQETECVQRWEPSCLLLSETLKQTAEQHHSSWDCCFGKYFHNFFFAIYTIFNDSITIYYFGMGGGVCVLLSSSLFLVSCFCFVLRQAFICSPGWPPTLSPTASAPQCWITGIKLIQYYFLKVKDFYTQKRNQNSILLFLSKFVNIFKSIPTFSHHKEQQTQQRWEEAPWRLPFWVSRAQDTAASIVC